MNLKNRQWWVIFLACMMMMMALTEVGATSTTLPSETPATFTEVTIQKGSITQNVIATGSLRYEKEESLSLPEALTLESIEVEAGESVTKGQVLAHYDIDALKESLKAAQDALLAQDETIAGLLSGQSSDQSVKTTIAGVVKKLNLEAGQPVQETLQGQPAAIISVNGLMEVAITPSQPLTLNQAVRVKVGKQVQVGSVARLEADGSALITFPDTIAKIDQVVQVTLNGVTIGEGKAQVSLPYQLYTQINGVVDSASVKVNSTVKRNSIIYQIINVSATADYLAALKDRADMYQTILRYEELIASPVFLSDKDGVVAQVTAPEKTAMQKGAELLGLYVQNTFVLDVAVDELDILSVQAGQEGTAALDAITNVKLPVEVKKISLLGTSTSGITSYTVTLSIQGDESLRSGMNGTVTLTVGEAKDSVLVPLAALMSDRGGSYVLLKGNTEAGTAQTQGVKTYVKVGLSDVNFAAVLEGLSEGDVVLVRSSALSTTVQDRQSQPGFGNIMNPDHQYNPGGGQH